MSEEENTNKDEKIFLFRVIVDNQQELLLSFISHNSWDRGAVIKQLSVLYPGAKSFRLFDGHLEVCWDNTEKDILDIIEKLKDPQKHVIEEPVSLEKKNKKKK